MTDLFNPTQHPKDKAISRSIEKAIDGLIAGNMDVADHYFEMAKEFLEIPKNDFNSTPATKTW